MKSKKVILNFLTDAIPLILIMLIGVYKSKLLIQSLPTDTVGLYQLYSQAIGYITIFEGGVTGALLYRLFKPVAEKDNKKISILLASGKKVFNWIALIMIVMSFAFSFVIPLLIKNNTFSIWYILLTFMLYASTNIIFYYISAYKILLDAQQKKHLNNLILQGTAIVKSIIELVVLFLGGGLIAILLVAIFTHIISAILIYIIYKKNNKELLKTKERDFSMLKDVKHLFIHKISGLVNHNIDLMITSSVLGLSYVVIYSAYNFVTNSLKQLVSKIYVSMVPVIGLSLHEDNEKTKEVFYEMNDFVFLMGTIIVVPLIIVINPFINIWYEGKIAISTMLAFGFSFVLFSAIICQPMMAFTEAAGRFKSTRICAIIEVVLNLTLSLILVNFWGIAGVLIATTISYTVAGVIIKSRIIIKEVLKSSVKRYYYQVLLLYGIFLFLAFTEYFLLRNIEYSSIGTWFIASTGIFIANATVVIIIYKLLNKTTFIKKFLRALQKGGVKNAKKS